MIFFVVWGIGGRPKGLDRSSSIAGRAPALGQMKWKELITQLRLLLDKVSDQMELPYRAVKQSQKTD
jgi:hypothetical protein